MICYLVVALSCTYGGVNEPCSTTALNWHADVGWMAAESAALACPRQQYYCCHDN